ncbi:transposable element Tcb2 transposase, partial [Trichonephila clavipes]
VSMNGNNSTQPGEENNSTRQHERNNSTGENNSTRQQERTTQLGSRNETTQLVAESAFFHLLPEHRQLRLQWSQSRSMWNVTDWQKVVFSDESRFVLGTDDNHVRMWRRPGERYNSALTVLRHTARTDGVMVWGAISYYSRSTVIVMCGTLTGQRYVDDILRPHVGPFLNGLPGTIFQQDNARPHTARVAQDFLLHF